MLRSISHFSVSHRLEKTNLVSASEFASKTQRGISNNKNEITNFRVIIMLAFSFESLLREIVEKLGKSVFSFLCEVKAGRKRIFRVKLGGQNRNQNPNY